MLTLTHSATSWQRSSASIAASISSPLSLTHFNDEKFIVIGDLGEEDRLVANEFHQGAVGNRSTLRPWPSSDASRAQRR